MRIVHLVDSLDFGGAEQMAASLAIHQSVKGHSASLVCLRDIGERPVKVRELAEAGVKVVTLGKPSGFHFGTLRRLATYLRDEQIDVLHAHNHLVHHYAAAAARWAGTPVILNTLHGSSSLQSATIVAKALYLLSCLISDRVVSVCSQVEKAFRESFFLLPRKRLSVVNNGIDLSQFLGIRGRERGESVTFGTIGRLEPVKDHENLLKAFSGMLKRHPRAQLRLLGEGTLRRDLEQLANTLSIAEQVHFEGFSLDTVQFLSSIDIYVISSRSEGLPLTLLEAMAAGLPVVATAVGELPAILGRTRCGWLCPPSNADRLAEAMGQAMCAPDLATAAAKGRKAAEEHFSVERMANDYEVLYSTVLSARSTRTIKQQL